MEVYCRAPVKLQLVGRQRRWGVCMRQFRNGRMEVYCRKAYCRKPVKQWSTAACWTPAAALRSKLLPRACGRWPSAACWSGTIEVLSIYKVLLSAVQVKVCAQCMTMETIQTKSVEKLRSTPKVVPGAAPAMARAKVGGYVYMNIYICVYIYIQIICSSC